MTTTTKYPTITAAEAATLTRAAAILDRLTSDATSEAIAARHNQPGPQMRTLAAVTRKTATALLSTIEHVEVQP